MPDIHGDLITFCCEGDVWVGDIKTGKATRLTRDDGEETWPKFSPNGKEIAFSAHLDGVTEVYVIPVSGGAPRRITYRNQFAYALDWTPDGKQIAIYSTPLAGKVVAPYLVPAAGGWTQNLPLEYCSELSYASDGNRFAFTRIRRNDAAWFRYEGGQKNDIWVGDTAKRAFRKIYEARFTSEYPAWMGDRIAFAADEGGTFSVLCVKPEGGGLKRLAGPYSEEIRNLNTDGKRLIYERGNALELYDMAAGKVLPVQFDLASDLMHTLPYLAPATQQIFGARLGPTGKRVLVETRGQIVSVPTKEGDVRLLLGKDGVRYRAATLSPDGKRLAYLSDETREQQLYVADTEGTKPRALTADRGRQLHTVTWSPDSKWIALTDSAKSLRLINIDTGKETRVGQGVRHDNWWDGPEPRFSPDSRWIVFSVNNNLTNISQILLFEIATGKQTLVSSGVASDFAPTFSTDGKWIAFLSRRHIAPFGDGTQNQLFTDTPIKAYLLALKRETFSPFLPENEEETPGTLEKPKETAVSTTPPKVDIDLEGLADRFMEVPVPPANYTQIAVVGDRILLSSYKTEDTAKGEALSSLTFYNLKEKKTGVVAENFLRFDVSNDNKKLLLYNRENSRIMDVTASTKVSDTDGKLDFANFQLRINPVAEWENMYWDAWRIIRDYFYVANLHGADWPAVGKKYAALLPSVRSRDELNQLLRWQLSELSVSHAGAGGGRQKRQRTASPRPAFLGIDVVPDASGYYKITKILRGDGFTESERSPLAAPGLNVKEGDFLIEVAGIPAKEGQNFQEGLLGRAGQVVTLKVNDKPTPDGARLLRVKPVASERRMRYIEWVKERRAYVERVSGGRLAYLHLDNMGISDMSDFIRQYFPQRLKEGLVVDTRFNGGGFIAQHVLNILRQKRIAFFNQRSDPQPWTRQADFFAGPMICLTNEFNGSDGEEFPYYFKALGLGPILGRRTWGGEVGSDPGWPLADGGQVSVPNYGAWTPENGWIIEGRGVSPDIDVENDPNAYAQGKDPQLDRAIAYLLAEIKKNPPPKKYTQPADPIRVGEQTRGSEKQSGDKQNEARKR
jgi:tricorn protease